MSMKCTFSRGPRNFCLHRPFWDFRPSGVSVRTNGKVRVEYLQYGDRHKIRDRLWSKVRRSSWKGYDKEEGSFKIGESETVDSEETIWIRTQWRGFFVGILGLFLVETT